MQILRRNYHRNSRSGRLRQAHGSIIRSIPQRVMRCRLATVRNWERSSNSEKTFPKTRLTHRTSHHGYRISSEPTSSRQILMVRSRRPNQDLRAWRDSVINSRSHDGWFDVSAVFWEKSFPNCCCAPNSAPLLNGTASLAAGLSGLLNHALAGVVPSDCCGDSCVARFALGGGAHPPFKPFTYSGTGVIFSGEVIASNQRVLPCGACVCTFCPKVLAAL